jgi:hypothetical protein
VRYDKFDLNNTKVLMMVGWIFAVEDEDEEVVVVVPDVVVSEVLAILCGIGGRQTILWGAENLQRR